MVTHPDVVVDPAVPVPRWPLSERGLMRMRALLEQSWVAGVKHVYSSGEQKAMDGARVLADNLGVEPHVIEELHENDRSSTGFLPKDEFWATAQAFFGEPDESVRGWETARAAQARFANAIETVIENVARADVAVVAHGGVTSLYLCALLDEPISMRNEHPGSNGGNYYAFDAATRKLLHGWRAIECG